MLYALLYYDRVFRAMIYNWFQTKIHYKTAF